MKTRAFQPKTRRNTARLNHSFLLLALLAMVFSGSCRPKQVVPPTSPPESGKPTETWQDSLLPVVDDGAPLPPQVIQRQPKGGQELPPDGQIVLTFDQPMDPETTNPAWQVIGPDGTPVEGDVAWPTARTLQFTPAGLETGKTYLARLHQQATSASGIALSDPLEFEFNTVGELQVSQVFPAGGTQDVASNAVITAIFNRPVVPLVVAESQADLINPLSISPPVAGHGEWVNTSVYAFRPEGFLKGGTTYTVGVKAGLADAAGESILAQDYEWQFTTATPSLTSLMLSDGLENPPSNYPNVRLDEYFTLRFNQPMDAVSTEAALSIGAQNGETVPLITDWNAEATQVIITPTQRLALGTDYLFSLNTNAQAVDGGALSRGLNWNFTTLPPPAIEYVSPPEEVHYTGFTGDLRIKFVSPMDLDSIKERVVITPKPEGEIQWWYNDYDWSVMAFILQPSTQYEVRLLPGMTDIYGNPIQEGRTVRFTTAAYDPQANLQMPYMPAMLRQDGPQEFYVTYRNVDSIELELYKLSAAHLADFARGAKDQYLYQPPAGDLVWQAKQPSTGALNERVLKSFTPLLASGDPLPPGFYFLGLNASGVNRHGPFIDSRILMVNTANLTFKTTSNEALMWLTDLDSGKPMPGVTITVYGERFEELGQGVTGGDGLLKLDIPAPKEPYERRYALVEDGPTQAFASSEWGSGVSFYDYGIWTSYYAPSNLPTAYVYTDRPIYRPGQPVYFKGIVRLDDDLTYSLPVESQVRVKIEDFEETVYEADLPLSSFGTFDGQILLDRGATLGYYTLSVRFPGQEESIGTLSFNVAEYRKPEFQVVVSAEPGAVLAGASYDITVKADYYSGGAVSEANVDWTIRSDPFSFTPGGDLSGYSFSDIESDAGFYEFEEQPDSKIIAQGQGETDANGTLVLTLPADLSEAKTSRRFTFESTLTDLSQNAVSGRTEVIAHRSGLYVGVRPKSYVGVANEEQQFELVAVDWDGNPLAGQMVDVEIVERRWYSVQEQDATGRVQWSSTVEEIPVTQISGVVMDANGKATVSFTPPRGGIYRARVSARDAQGNPVAASAYLWVAGDEYIPWRQTNDRGFALVADRAQYLPGDTAQILIASPFQGEAYALVTVERGRIRRQEVILLTGNSTLYQLPVSADLAPNAYVSVMVVKGVDETNPRPDFRLGIVEIKVEPRQQAMTVEVIPDRTQAGPGEVVNYTVRTLDAQGSPVSAEVSLGLSDLATLSLTGPNSAPILEHFYSRRILGVWTSMSIVVSLEDYNATIEERLNEGQGMGSGGGKGEGDWGVIDVRQDFPDTAFWEAHLVTNENGEATVTVRLPDNLTTWRMDARAVTLDTRVGQTIHDLVSTKPLLVRPQTPRFFVVGDQVRLGAAVHNNTGQTLNVTVSLSGEGISLQGPADQTLEIAAMRQAFLTWEASVNPDAQRVDLIFSAESSGADGYRDATRPTQGTLDNQGIPVYRYEALETVGTSGQMTAGGSRTEAISLPPTESDLAVSQGNLTIQIAPSLAAGMTDGLSYLEHYPYECIEQTISRFLPNALTTKALKEAGLSDPDLEANLQTQVSTALQRLYNWQNPDGGWSWWPSRNREIQAKSEVQTTAYAALGLVETRLAGYPINENVLERAVNFLARSLKPVKGMTDPAVLNRQAFVLYVLARAGKPQVSSAVQLYDERQGMSLYAQAFLAHTLYLIDDQDPRLKTLLSDFASQAILSATGSHWEEKEDDPWNWNTDTRTTAIVLSTLSQLDPGNPLNANAVRWLMSNRTGGHWQGTQETAWTLMALTNWMVASGELQANYQYAVALNGERLGGGTANAETLRQSLELQVEAGKLIRDQANRLVFARDDGAGNLYYSAHLNVFLPVEHIPALDQGIIVSRNYYRPEDPNTPVSEAQVGDLLLGRLTIVAPNELHYAVVDDPLPAGLEAVDQSLATSPQNQEVPQTYQWDDVFRRGWGWWYFDHVQLRDEKVLLSASYLPAGTYVYTYLVRAATAGAFRTIPATAQEFYFPEVYGRGEGSLFTVLP